MIDHHVRSPMPRVVIRVDIAEGDGGSLGAGIAARLDVAQVIADEQHAGRVQVEHLAGEDQRLGIRFAVFHMIRADQQRRALGQAQLLHDRFGETHRLVGHHAPDQVAFLDIGQQLGHAVV
ncbi:hypothetical protein D9M73_282180 [compost metagenome]